MSIGKDNFKLYLSRSGKFVRIKLILKYYELPSLGAHKTEKRLFLGNRWKKFLIKWEKFDDKQN